MPANNELVTRDLPGSPGFSSTSTRRSASSARDHVTGLEHQPFQPQGTSTVPGSHLGLGLQA